MASAAKNLIENAASLYAMGRCDMATGMLADALDACPSQVDILKALVAMLVDSERHQAALNILAKERVSPEEPSLTLLHAACLLSLGDLAEAGKIAERLLETDSQRAEAITLKARIAQHHGELEEAEQLFARAISIDAECAAAHLGLGCIRRDIFHHPDCLEHFKKAFLAKPFSRETAIAFHEAAAAIGEWPIAEEAFRQASARHRINRRLRFLLIDVLLRQGKFEDAMSEVESCIADFGADDGLLNAALNIRQKIGVLRAPEEGWRKRSVSLCMIVKNEEEQLARCLRSVTPLVGEIIVVDTGSTDKTKEIAAVFGAKVFDFPWCDDFSAARNFSLSKASGGWILVLDADEVISVSDHRKFRALLEAEADGNCAFRIQTRNYTHHSNTIGWKPNSGEYQEEEGGGWFPSDKVRLFKNDPRICFVNPVHELVEPSLEKYGIAVLGCEIPVHHFGKLHEAKTKEKTKTYCDLGRNKLKKNRRSLAALRELAIQSSHLGRHDESTKLWREYLKRQPQSAEAYVNLGTAYWNRGRYREAIDCARQASRLNPSMKEARFNLGVALLMACRAGEGRSVLLQLLEEHPDHSAARFMLCVACACLGDTQRVEAEMPKMKATPLGPFLSESFLDVAKRFHSSSQPDCARRVLEAAVRHDFASAEVIALLEKVRKAA